MGHSYGLDVGGSGYRVVSTKHGILVFGSIPIPDMVALAKSWQEERGFNMLDLGVAAALGANFAITANQETGAAWRAEVDAAVEAKYGKKSDLTWLHGTDTGASSLTIFSVLSSLFGGGPAMERGTIHGVSFSPGIPRDPDDFGRCVRLLEWFPWWRARLPEVVAKYPAWAPLVAEWDALEALYREESAAGEGSRLYDRMQELTKAAT